MCLFQQTREFSLRARLISQTFHLILHCKCFILTQPRRNSLCTSHNQISAINCADFAHAGFCLGAKDICTFHFSTMRSLSGNKYLFYDNLRTKSARRQRKDAERADSIYFCKNIIGKCAIYMKNCLLI